MTRFPKIRIQGWHTDGPVYQVERSLAGWRNRKARRHGEAEVEQVGHPGGRNVEEGAAFMAFALGDDEIYAFNRGHVYQVDVLVDGDGAVIHVDAREDYELMPFQGGVQLLEWRALSEDELAELLDDNALVEGEPQLTGAPSDASESQEPAPVVEPEAPAIEPEDELRSRVAAKLDVALEEVAEFDRAQLEQLDQASSAVGEDVVGGDSGKPGADEEE